MLERLSILDPGQCAADKLLRRHQKLAELTDGGNDLFLLLLAEFREKTVHCALEMPKHIGY